MTSRDFCYFMQSLFEVAEIKSFSEKQTEQIKNHLAMVFIHEIDPSMGDKEHQGKLNAAHSEKPHKPFTFQDSTSHSTMNSSEESPPALPTMPLMLQDHKSSLIARC